MSFKLCYPGTKVPASASSLLNGVFSATRGMTLSQVCELTGIGPSTIQNWVKRGYVNSPVNKKYSKSQVARIIIINMLRDTMEIEKIARLLSYVNGDLLDSSDDIIDDSEIYDCLCNILIPASMEGVADTREIFSKIDKYLEGYKGPTADSANKLRLTLQAMVCSYESANLMRYVDQLLENI